MGVAQAMTCFRPSVETAEASEAKRPRLHPAVSPGVALVADEIHYVAYQAFNKGMAMAAAQLSSCWNCGDPLHKKMECPNLPQQPANPFQRS
eukprot:1425122-Rhodomonas_salina.1